MIVLGIDPGFDRLGLAIIKKNQTKEEVLFSACFQTNKKDDFPTRLLHVAEKVIETINHWRPEVIALETILFSKNQKTALQVAEVRGVLLYLAKKHNLIVAEYNPLQIKQTICGFGGADKKQIIDMVQKLVSLPTKKTTDDEYDAVAIGLTHIAHHKFINKPIF